METAIDHFNSSPVDAVKNRAILTYCKTALSVVMNSHEFGDYHLVIDRVRLSLIQLHNINCHIAIGWIPAHSGIYYNEQADTLANFF